MMMEMEGDKKSLLKLKSKTGGEPNQAFCLAMTQQMPTYAGSGCIPLDETPECGALLLMMDGFMGVCEGCLAAYDEALPAGEAAANAACGAAAEAGFNNMSCDADGCCDDMEWCDGQCEMLMFAHRLAISVPGNPEYQAMLDASCAPGSQGATACPYSCGTCGGGAEPAACADDNEALAAYTLANYGMEGDCA